MTCLWWRSGFFYQQKNYTSTWDKIKAKSYQIPHDANALQHAKQQKIILSNVRFNFYFILLLWWCSISDLYKAIWILSPVQVKYKEDYEKFKSLYSLPKSLEDDPGTARCVKAGKLVLDVSSICFALTPSTYWHFSWWAIERLCCLISSILQKHASLCRFYCAYDNWKNHLFFHHCSVCTRRTMRKPRPRTTSPQTCWISCLPAVPRMPSARSTTASICTSGFACLTCRCTCRHAKSMNSSAT